MMPAAVCTSRAASIPWKRERDELMSSNRSRERNYLTHRHKRIILGALNVGDRDLVAHCLWSIFLKVSSEVRAVVVLSDVSDATGLLLSAECLRACYY